MPAIIQDFSKKMQKIFFLMNFKKSHSKLVFFHWFSLIFISFLERLKKFCLCKIMKNYFSKIRELWPAFFIWTIYIPNMKSKLLWEVSRKCCTKNFDITKIMIFYDFVGLLKIVQTLSHKNAIIFLKIGSRVWNLG